MNHFSLQVEPFVSACVIRIFSLSNKTDLIEPVGLHINVNAILH